MSSQGAQDYSEDSTPKKTLRRPHSDISGREASYRLTAVRVPHIGDDVPLLDPAVDIFGIADAGVTSFDVHEMLELNNNIWPANLIPVHPRATWYYAIPVIYPTYRWNWIVHFTTGTTPTPGSEGRVAGNLDATMRKFKPITVQLSSKPYSFSVVEHRRRITYPWLPCNTPCFFFLLSWCRSDVSIGQHPYRV